ncbi:MJ0042-type zinc finger domain-containing protein [Maricaulis sp.]|uniref:MJ0042-type zinc finger domain-containing protein n=1 Tax=Maricaulis sp. TaxID=1486257 RepID=UPI003A924AC5
MSIVLSCPSCSTRYRADPHAIGLNGRRVRCASCAHVWTAEAEDPSDLPTLQPAPPEADSAAESKPHTAFRERQAKKRRTMSAAVAGGAWGGLAIACALLLTASWIFRVDIVTLWPRASSAYAAMGAEVNPYGFTVGELTVTRDNAHGVPLLVIEGTISNLDRRSRALPALRAILRDENSESLLEWSVGLQGAAVPAGQVRDFRTVVSDPPPASAEVEVVLVADATPVHSVTPEPAHTAEHAPEQAVATDSHTAPAADHAPQPDAGHH